MFDYHMLACDFMMIVAIMLTMTMNHEHDMLYFAMMMIKYIMT